MATAASSNADSAVYQHRDTIEMMNSPCLVCNQTQRETKSRMHLLDVVAGADERRTIRARLEFVLNESLNKAKTQVICSCCHSNLVLIENYFALLSHFRAQYQWNAELRGERNELASSSFNPESLHQFSNMQSSGRPENEKLESEYDKMKSGRKRLSSNDGIDLTVPRIEIKDEQDEQDEQDDEDSNDQPSKQDEKTSNTKEKIKKTASSSAKEENKDKIVGKNDCQCTICGKVFKQAERLRRHLLEHESGVIVDIDKKHFCAPCSKHFERRSELFKHYKEHHSGEKPFACDKCEQRFRLPFQLKDHQRVHSGEKPYTCKECGKSFHKMSNLRGHEATVKHTGEKNHVCPKCGKMFKTSHSLNVHIDTAHETVGPYEFHCGLCGKGFHFRGSLMKHAMNHNKEKPFLCTVCGKSFRLKITLQHHSLIHTNEKPFKCRHCGKAFRHEVTLKGHEMTHTGDYPLRCPICNKGFSRKVDLKRHSTSHGAVTEVKIDQTSQSSSGQGDWTYLSGTFS